MWPPGQAPRNQTANKGTDCHVAPLLAMTEVKRVEALSSAPTPPAPAKRSGAEREATGITNFTPMVDGVPIRCPVRSEASARRPIPRESPTRGGTEPAPYRPTESPQCNTPVTAPPSIPGMVSKGRAHGPFLWAYQGGLGGNLAIPPEFFFGGLGVYSFNSERIHPQMPQVITCSPSPPERRALPAPLRGQKPPGFPGASRLPAAPARGARSPHPSGNRFPKIYLCKTHNTVAEKSTQVLRK